ncbi:ribosomal RNA small subunit methyltransferase I [Striga asiatica]|uniref:Ribosomal RNA small subunit methyltransferase I n=1 Tax=Striga asiatica TaxID=4170 RepID=A0A5A7P1D0_STRAF|nr:ribosomal RNA small subunit methyltransferase I [Striga asiatica]
MLLRRCPSIAPPFPYLSPPLARRWRRCPISSVPSYLSLFSLSSSPHATISAVPFSTGNFVASEGDGELTEDFPSKQGPLKPGLYLVGTPIGNLEDITLRALRVLKSADVILSEDTRHSGKLLHCYNIRTPLLSYHKFNESQREQVVLKRLLDKEIVALISDAGMPGISDPGMELAKLCVDKNIPVIPVPGPSAVVAALSASGLPTNEFTFVGFLPKHGTTRRERLMVAANNATTQVFFVPPHNLFKFLEDASSIFGQHRRCVIAREMTKMHEEVRFEPGDLLM